MKDKNKKAMCYGISFLSMVILDFAVANCEVLCLAISGFAIGYFCMGFAQWWYNKIK